MSTKTIKVAGRAQMRKFVDFPVKLYKGCRNYVPALRGDEFDTFNPKKNDAYEFCDAECYLCYKDGKVAGRVAAIINRKSNETWKEHTVRFGWIDFIEDKDVLHSLLEAVREFGLRHGCDTIKGPLGFTDMDREGLLVEGFDKLSSFTCIYNYPYYGPMLEAEGFRKDADWTQRTVEIQKEYPPMYRFADHIAERYELHLDGCRNIRELADKYGMAVFHLYNESFAPLFQFTPLSDTQIKTYLKTYIPILDKDFVSVVLNAEDKPVGFAFCVPTLSLAVLKSKGRLFPLGVFRILKALRKPSTIEALMIGVLPEYQGKGVMVPMFKYLHENCIRRGVTKMIMNPQLEENFKVQTLFDQFNPSFYTRRRSYIRAI